MSFPQDIVGIVLGWYMQSFFKANQIDRETVNHTVLIDAVRLLKDRFLIEILIHLTIHTSNR